MTREEFIRGYMSRSGIEDYSVDGEHVIQSGGYCQCALPCACGEDGCEGWAMIPPSGREWHLWNNGGEGAGALPSGMEAMRADMAYMRAERAVRKAGKHDADA